MGLFWKIMNKKISKYSNNNKYNRALKAYKKKIPPNLCNKNKNNKNNKITTIKWN